MAKFFLDLLLLKPRPETISEWIGHVVVVAGAILWPVIITAVFAHYIICSVGGWCE